MVPVDLKAGEKVASGTNLLNGVDVPRGAVPRRAREPALLRICAPVAMDDDIWIGQRIADGRTP